MTLAPLAGVLEHSGRLRAAEDRVAAELAMLADGRWLVERSVRVGSGRIPFLVLGAGGVFVLWGTDGAWTLADLRFMADRAAEVRRRLPGYGGPVHAAMCLAFDEIQPRLWFGGQEHGGRGGWVLGVERLRPWLLSFGTEHGVREGDVRRLREPPGRCGAGVRGHVCRRSRALARRSCARRAPDQVLTLTLRRRRTEALGDGQPARPGAHAVRRPGAASLRP